MNSTPAFVINPYPPHSTVPGMDEWEAYRRWVCSTLIPYFAEMKDVKNNETTQGGKFSVEAKSRVDRSIQTNHNRFGETDENSLTEVLKRSRRKSKTRTPRRRIRPCLSVCQTVEQKCPYMLPGDRAPAHPTQYAGEPTFLCLDPNIPETGEQFYKSNNGPDNCCYKYCGSPGEGLCSQCDLPTTIQHKNNDTSNFNNNLNTTNSNPNIYTKNNNQKTRIADERSDMAVDTSDTYNYDEIPQQLPVCQSSTSVATIPKSWCPLPYYKSPNPRVAKATTDTRILGSAEGTVAPDDSNPDRTTSSTAVRESHSVIRLIVAALLLTSTYNIHLPWTIDIVLDSVTIMVNAPVTTWIQHIIPQLAGL